VQLKYVGNYAQGWKGLVFKVTVTGFSCITQPNNRLSDPIRLMRWSKK